MLPGFSAIVANTFILWLPILSLSDNFVPALIWSKYSPLRFKCRLLTARFSYFGNMKVTAMLSPKAQPLYITCAQSPTNA